MITIGDVGNELTDEWRVSLGLDCDSLLNQMAWQGPTFILFTLHTLNPSLDGQIKTVETFSRRKPTRLSGDEFSQKKADIHNEYWA